MQPGWGSLLWFIAVVAMIPVALWLLKRSPLGQAARGRPGTPRTVAVLPLTAQHKLVTLEVGQGDERLWLVVGLGPQGMRTLHTMAALDEPSDLPPPPPAAAFAQLLSRLRGKDGGDA